LDTSVRLFQSVIDTCVRENIKDIIILGDFFHDRKAIHAKALETAVKIAGMLRPFNVTLIPGNHDVFYKDIINPTSLDIFLEYENIKIPREVVQEDGLILVPWGKTDDFLEIDDSDSLVLGHFEINGFIASSNYIFTNSKFNVESFRNYKKILSGHFHIPSTKGNITYLGAPFQMNFGDANGIRGYNILNEDGSHEFIEFTDAPKFAIITTRKLPSPELITNNIVKVIFLRDYGTNKNNKLLEYIQRFKPLQVISDFSRITDSNKIEEKLDESVVIKDHKEILFEYMEKTRIPRNLNFPTVKGMVELLLREGEPKN
jgi:DNA repair exonuclease SbcCD nuclease subunit